MTVATADLESEGRAWTRLLGLRPERAPGQWRFQLANTALELRPAGDAAGSPPAPRLDRLVFAGDPPGRGSARGVAVEVATAGPAPARAVCSGAAEPVGCVVALDHVVVRCGDLDASLAVYRDDLGLRLALDRSFPERRVRLVFFRVGGVTVELSGSLDDPPHETTRDTLWGLAWRVPALDAAHRRLAGAGFAVSAPRAGHKAGTRVFHLDEPPSSVPTLMLEDPARDDVAPEPG